jgi:beta-fructofuranosidase
VNDGVYGGVYSVALPKKVALGEKLKLHVFLDGSIAEIFVNDTWAYSVRIFPNDAAAVEAEVFATNQMQTNVKAWTLNAGNPSSGIKSLWMSQRSDNSIYDLQGRHLNVVPQKRIYINNGKKYVSR